MGSIKKSRDRSGHTWGFFTHLCCDVKLLRDVELIGLVLARGLDDGAAAAVREASGQREYGLVHLIGVHPFGWVMLWRKKTSLGIL